MQNFSAMHPCFDGRNYDSEHAVDHFFKDQLFSMADSLITENGVVSFSEFHTWNISTCIKGFSYTYNKLKIATSGLHCIAFTLYLLHFVQIWI